MNKFKPGDKVVIVGYGNDGTVIYTVKAFSDYEKSSYCLYEIPFYWSEKELEFACIYNQPLTKALNEEIS